MANPGWMYHAQEGKRLMPDLSPAYQRELEAQGWCDSPDKLRDGVQQFIDENAVKDDHAGEAPGTLLNVKDTLAQATTDDLVRELVDRGYFDASKEPVPEPQPNPGAIPAALSDLPTNAAGGLPEITTADDQPEGSKAADNLHDLGPEDFAQPGTDPDNEDEAQAPFVDDAWVDKATSANLKTWLEDRGIAFKARDSHSTLAGLVRQQLADKPE